MMNVFGRLRKERQTAIVVLGARSGTSALAGTLGLLGCRLPENLLPANYANPKGYFEPESILSLHDALLASVGLHWSDAHEFPPSWFDSLEAQSFGAQLALAYQEEFRKAPLTVLKEPRMCRLMPLWSRIFRDLSVVPIHCFIDRPPLEVASSLEARDGTPLKEGLLYYIRNHLDGEKATRGTRRVFMRYSDFLSDWGKSLKPLAAAVSRNLYGNETQQQLIKEFLDPRLQHQAAQNLGQQRGKEFDMANAVHEAFTHFAANGREHPETHGVLDQLRSELNGLAHPG